MAVSKKLFTELFRAKRLDQLILPSRIRTELEKGLVTHTFLYGPAGTGKTTIARILTEGYDVLKLNGSSENGIDVIRNQVVDFASTMSLMGGSEKLKVIFIDEADGLTENAWDALRETLERYHESVRYICTCNKFNKIPEPIKSRFNCIPVYPVTVAEEQEVIGYICEYVRKILKGVNVTCANDEVLFAFVKNHFPDMRTILNSIQSLYVQGVTELNTDSIIKTFECADLFNMIVTGNDPVENYKLVMGNYSSYPDDVMMTLSKTFIDFIRTNYPQYNAKIPHLIVAIAEYMAQLPTAPDKVLVMLACCFKLQLILRN
jgi:DNA polymerase III delta prime subunit